MVKQQIAFYGSTRTYTPVLAAHGWQGVTAQLHRKSVEGDWKGMADLITDEMLDTYAVIATYDDLHAKIMERYRGLLDAPGCISPTSRTSTIRTCPRWCGRSTGDHPSPCPLP